MLTNSFRSASSELLNTPPVQARVRDASAYPRLAPVGEISRFDLSQQDQLIGASPPLIDIAPRHLVARRVMKLHGMGVEFVQATSHDRINFSFRSSMHLLAAYQHGTRREGESCVEGLPRSRLRDLTRRLIFAPASHAYHEWHDPRTLLGVMYFYFDPAELQEDFELRESEMSFAPRLLFEDATILGTALKLKQALDAGDAESRLYAEALGVVLVHEFIRLDRGAPRAEAPIRGGLAAWQRRIVAAYINEHLPEQIRLGTLASLARLSTYYFCRAFKQSFGIPPHRYHTNRRIEQAKVLLAARKQSVTEVGLGLGFSDTSSFSAAFRKITGQTPSAFQRSLG